MNAPVRTRQASARETDTSQPVRKRVRQGNDRYAFDKSIIPDGWVYQWKRHTVLGQEDHAYQAELAQVGFTPVPAERHEGVFLPVGYKGSIIIGGQILMERPVELEREARMEDRDRANAQVRGSREQFGLRDKTRFEDRSKLRVGVEQVDAPRPKYQPSIDD
jgi:hypothetical protein